MQRVFLVLALAAASAHAQAPSLTPEEDVFARQMISCGQKFVALKLLQPGSSSPMQIAVEGRVYPKAARAVAGDAFVDQETPRIHQNALEYVSKIARGGKRATVVSISDVRRECDQALAASSGGR